MIAFRWLIPFILAAPMPVLGQTDEGLPEETELSDEAQLTQDRYERLTVPVMINGDGPFQFLIDTGSQATAVTPELVERLALEANGEALLVAVGSTRLVQTVELEELEFANRYIGGLVSPLLKRTDIGADGILGLDSLQDLRVLIDFRGDRMLVADAEELGGNSGYEIIVRARKKLGQLVIADARVAGIRTAVIVDTGAQNTIANRALIKRLRATNGAAKLSSVDVLGAKVFSDLAFLPSMTIGGIELTNVPVGMTSSPVFEYLGLTRKPAIVLGIGNLRVFDRVAIDFSSRRVLFDLPQGVRRSAARQWASRLRE